MTSIEPDETLRFEDKPTLCKLAQAMAYVECGQLVGMDDIEFGYDIS